MICINLECAYEGLPEGPDLVVNPRCPRCHGPMRVAWPGGRPPAPAEKRAPREAVLLRREQRNDRAARIWCKAKSEGALWRWELWRDGACWRASEDSYPTSREALLVGMKVKDYFETRDRDRRARARQR